MMKATLMRSLSRRYGFFFIDILYNFPGTIKFGDVTSIRLSVLSMRSKNLKRVLLRYIENFPLLLRGWDVMKMGCYKSYLLQILEQNSEGTLFFGDSG